MCRQVELSGHSSTKDLLNGAEGSTTSRWNLPETLDPGVLHDGARRDRERGIDGGVSRWDRRGPLVLRLLLLMEVLVAHPLSSQALDAGLDLGVREIKCQCLQTVLYHLYI